MALAAQTHHTLHRSTCTLSSSRPATHSAIQRLGRSHRVTSQHHQHKHQPTPASTYASNPGAHLLAASATRRNIAVGMAAAGGAPAGGGATASAASSPPPIAAETVVQKQLEAYNARDLEAFMALLSDDCVAKEAVTGAVMAQGHDALRARYAARFQTEVHSELLGRLVLGEVVIDREIISGLPDGAAADCMATYFVKDGLIRRMEFVWQPRP